MNKTVMISFRTTQELRECLDRIGREKRRSRSSMIETILNRFLFARADDDSKAVSPEEKRALAQIDGDAAREDDMTTIVLGGMRISLPKDLPCKIAFDEKTSALQISFGSDHEEKPESRKYAPVSLKNQAIVLQTLQE
jgi:predicted transcriptional regulator